MRRIASLLGSLVLMGCSVFAGLEPKLRIVVAAGPAEVHQFRPETIEAPARTVVAIDFTNVSALDHNFVFIDPIVARSREIVGPGTSDTIQFETPTAGSYSWVCTVHEDMRGTLLVR